MNNIAYRAERSGHNYFFFFFFTAFLSTFLFLTSCASTTEKQGSTQLTDEEKASTTETPDLTQINDEGKTSLEEQWGITVEGIRLSASGYMLDFRYRIMDPEKASLLMNRAFKPYLVDQASGARFAVPNPPKVGPLRQTSVKPYADRIYFIFFANPGRYVKKGNLVTVVIGDFKAEDLVVE